jgi:hypothetical protein
MVPKHGSSIWEPPTGTVVLATMVVVDEVHGANENFKKRGKRRRAVPEQVIAAVRATMFHVEHSSCDAGSALRIVQHGFWQRSWLATVQ